MIRNLQLGFSSLGDIWRQSDIESDIIEISQGVSSPIRPISNPYKQWEFSSNNIRTDYSSNCLHESFGLGEWITSDYPVNAYLQWKNNRSKVLVRSYDLDNSYRGTAGASGWQLEGSNDGINWTMIDERSGIDFSSNTIKSYNCESNDTKYYYHRFLIVSYGSFGCIGRIKTYKQAR